jgi:hypothetical protein
LIWSGSVVKAAQRPQGLALITLERKIDCAVPVRQTTAQTFCKKVSTKLLTDQLACDWRYKSMFFIGADIDKRKIHCVLLLDPETGKKRNKAIPNTAAGIKQLLS